MIHGRILSSRHSVWRFPSSSHSQHSALLYTSFTLHKTLHRIILGHFLNLGKFGVPASLGFDFSGPTNCHAILCTAYERITRLPLWSNLNLSSESCQNISFSFATRHPVSSISVPLQSYPLLAIIAPTFCFRLSKFLHHLTALEP